MCPSWDLAFVDLVLFKSVESDELFASPQLRRSLVCDARQVVIVRVEREAPSATIEVERIPARSSTGSTRYRWDRDRFFSELDAGAKTRNLADGLAHLADQGHGVLTFGTGLSGSTSFKLGTHSMLEIVTDGSARFRTRRIGKALGDDLAARYIAKLEELFPGKIIQARR